MMKSLLIPARENLFGALGKNSFRRCSAARTDVGRVHVGKLPLTVIRTVSAITVLNPLTVRLSLTLRVRVPRNVPGVPMLHAGLAAGGQPPRGCEGQRDGARLEP